MHRIGLAAIVFIEHILGDAKEPGGKSALVRVKLLQMLIHADKGIADQFVGQAAVLRFAQQILVHPGKIILV